jgi:hypothetical protein
MVLWDMFLGFNLDEDEEVIEEGLPIQSDYHTRSKGPIHNNNQLLLKLQILGRLGLWLLLLGFPSNIPNTNKPSTSYPDSMEYNIIEDLKNIKSNISILNVCKISQQWKLLLNTLKDIDAQPTTIC